MSALNGKAASKAGVNDFVIRFANVNGTGSASANGLFTKAIFRMGIPVTAKNIFPSNIQGLPTWYEVRVSDKGYLGRREGVDFLVGVNPQSMKADIDAISSGGYFLYDSSNKRVVRLSKAISKRIPLAIGHWIPFAGIIMIVVYFVGSHDLFHWTHHDVYEGEAADKILTKKAVKKP